MTHDATPAAGPAVAGVKANRIFLLLQDAIQSGRLEPGATLPGELKLAEQYDVSRVTVRRALEALREAGLVTRRPGVGTVVQAPPLASTLTASVANLLPNMVRMSEASEVRLLEFRYMAPGRTIRDRLGLAASERVQRSIRVRLMDDVPFSHLTTHVPERIAAHYSEADLAKTPLFALLERGGVQVGRATQTISATLANGEVAQALEVPEGAPLIALTRVVYDQAGHGVEHLDALYRPDRYRLQIDLNRAGAETERYWEPLADPDEGAAG
ncbi:GntR family transcriptional regulator [Roseospira goensis]|uniref:GntR family transcriptional regulator n=1 Tax=Roseospira goensis TaxID=391922 RepID=A0A7W6S207_9PROT|nr:GntR family transcriptional regulator [Roseospira goensis]MBB4287465.1 GntR family transcriptional regulator [Roseospira goensis]